MGESVKKEGGATAVATPIRAGNQSTKGKVEGRRGGKNREKSKEMRGRVTIELWGKNWTTGKPAIAWRAERENPGEQPFPPPVRSVVTSGRLPHE